MNNFPPMILFFLKINRFAQSLLQIGQTGFSFKKDFDENLTMEYHQVYSSLSY